MLFPVLERFMDVENSFSDGYSDGWRFAMPSSDWTAMLFSDIPLTTEVRFFSVGVIRCIFTLLMRCCYTGKFPLESVCCVMFAVLGSSYIAELLPSLSARGCVVIASRSGVKLL